MNDYGDYLSIFLDPEYGRTKSKLVHEKAVEFKELLDSCLNKDYHELPRNRVLHALSVAAHYHETSGKPREDAKKTPYIIHPMDVACHIMRAYGMGDPIINEAVICAALLHGTLEDTALTPAELYDAFGPEVMGIVCEVTDDAKRCKTDAEKRAAQLLRARTLSPHGLWVKLADSISNLYDTLHHPSVDWPVEGRLAYFQSKTIWLTQVNDHVAQETGKKLKGVLIHLINEGIPMLKAKLRE